MSGRGAYYKALYGSGGRRRGGGEEGGGRGGGGGRGFRRGGYSYNPRPFTAESGGIGSSGSGFPADQDGGDYYSSSCYEQQQQYNTDAAAATGEARYRGGSLRSELIRLEGRPYGAYNDILGVWDVDTFQLFVDKIQRDPFAPPSKFRVRLPQRIAGFPPHLYKNLIRTVGLCDYLTRRFSQAVQRGGLDEAASHGGNWSSSKGGDIRIDTPGQHVLQRTTFVVSNEAVEARCTIALPARGRSIEGRRAAERLCDQLPAVVKDAMYYRSLDPKDVEAHVLSIEDQEFLRGQLSKMNLAAFVVNGACLPRASGNDDRPLTKEKAPELVLFKSPPSLEVSVELPNRGLVRGMGIPRGITLIVGGGFHGKTTLLEALQWGIYNKVPGDGREFVVVEPASVKIRAEDGRSVVSVDISPFINNLPFGKQTTRFSSADASGSTSQAANIMEALELGATTLLVDEDTCATNFMIRDKRMQALVAKDKEPITPFVHKIRPLLRQYGVGTIMVVGGSGDFFDVADNVIMMDCYRAICVTQQAKNISQMFRAESSSDEAAGDQHADHTFGDIGYRVINEGCLSQHGKVKAVGTRTISYGDTEIDLSCVEQLAEASQTRAISRCLQRLSEATGDRILDGRRTLPEILAAVWNIIASSSTAGTGYNGLDALSPFADPTGDLALPRKIELGFAINRLRKLRVNNVVTRGPGDRA